MQPHHDGQHTRHQDRAEYQLRVFDRGTAEQQSQGLANWLRKNQSGNQAEFEAKHLELDMLLVQFEHTKKL